MEPAQVCPYLGLRDDPATHFAFASSAQVCHAKARPSLIDPAMQARDCLTERHTSCPRYHPPVPAAPIARLAPIGRPVRPAPPTHEDGQASRIGTAGRPAHRRSGRCTLQLLVVVALLAAVGAVGVLLGNEVATLLGDQGGGARATLPASAPATQPATSPSASATASPTASPTPSPTPTVTPTPAPTPVIHVVRRGESLTQIAARYGVTVAAIQAANSLADPNLIDVGQELIIPAP